MTSPPPASAGTDFEGRAGQASFRVACLMAPAVGASVGLGAAWPVAVAGPLALAYLYGHLRGYGAAPSAWPDAVTALRIALTACLGLGLPDPAPSFAAASVLVIFGLDGLDGLLARRLQAASPRGGRLDMESDAFFVMVVCVRLSLHGLGPWILLGGLLRYAYVLTLRIFRTRGEAPRNRIARYAYAAALSAYVAAWLAPPPVAPALGATATLILVWSFGRSFWWAFRAPPAG